MRYAAMALILVSAVFAGVTAAAGQTGDDARIQEWIDQLGRPRYADRENASQQLRAIGLPALESLRKATKSPDLEIRRRAELLVRKLEDEQHTVALLAPKRLRLNVQDVTVTEAVAQLAILSGYPIQLSGNPSILTARKVTLDTGETTFWEAARQLCDKAGLVETPGAAATTYSTGPVGKAATKKVTRSGGTASLQWTIGDPAERPTASTGSVRVQVVWMAVTPRGEIDLMLEVTPEPRLVDFSALGTATIDKAVNDRGEYLASATATDHDGTDAMERKLAGRINARVVVANGNVIVSGSGLESNRQVRVRLEPPQKRGTKLQELTGKIPVQVLIEDEPIIVIEKILDAAGKTARGKDDATLDVHKVARLPSGDVHIQATMENLPGLNNLFARAGNIKIQGGGPGANLVINPNAAMGGETVAPGGNLPRLLDAAGKSYALVQAATSRLVVNGNNISVTADWLYRPQPGQGPPVQLAVPGQRHFVFEVPFTLKDLRLP